jgi:hypothetical protein
MLLEFAPDGAAHHAAMAGHVNPRVAGNRHTSVEDTRRRRRRQAGRKIPAGLQKDIV